MSISRSKQLEIVTIELYSITDSFIYKLRNKQKPNQNVFDYLPKYAISDSSGKILDASYYHQFTGLIAEDNTDKSFWFVDVKTTSASLEHDFDEIGIIEVFEDIDFRKILTHFTPNNEDDFCCSVIPDTINLIVEIEYWGGYDAYGGDYDAKYDIIGYLDKNMDKILFNSNNFLGMDFISGYRIDFVENKFLERGKGILMYNPNDRK